ncbi:hypothetical protein [Mesorhizobium sp. ZC-5]|uniref:hypothetical protein n=1 Tax=Mesorhizobium sp. ZC-5 TaxID=2986066 RepID=UPI0021E95B20|nr:hypothetical protein [Mesorhizobium sp. ZC-5]MCV3243013.1 hypothetical protein [Mesorhizobium sp. ZC-5]
MSAIQDFSSSTNGFYRKSAVDQLLILSWFVETHEGRPFFDGSYMRKCFRDVGLDPPDMSVYLPRLVAKKPPQLVREKGGYRLAGGLRRDLDRRFGVDPVVAVVTQTLSELPQKVPDLAERAFLTEALNCYRVRAYRAAIVMTWNLAYDHLVRWLFKDASRIVALNAAIGTKFPKKSIVINNIEDLDDLKEYELIESCRVARLLDKNTVQILKDKLSRRNIAAHPSRVIINQHQADDTISDLVNNVILFLT